MLLDCKMNNQDDCSFKMYNQNDCTNSYKQSTR